MAVNGRLLHVLAALEQPRHRQELLALPSVSSEAWFDNRLKTLQSAGLVHAERVGRTLRVHTRDVRLSRAAADLLRARPDVRLGWSTSLPLRVLLTLPTWRGPPTPAQVAGCSDSAWNHMLSDLQQNGFALRRENGQVIVNPRIAELNRLLEALRDQLALVPDDLIEIPGTGSCIHVRGAEAAWRVPPGRLREGYRPVGPAADKELALLVDPFMVAFAGERVLDRWDHALIYARAHLRADVQGERVEPRAVNALAFLAGRHLPQDAEFGRRCTFYGMPELPALVSESWRIRPDEVARFSRAGHQEGYLDQ